MDYKLDEDEVVLYEGEVHYPDKFSRVKYVLTSKKMVFIKTITVSRGWFKGSETHTEVDIVNLSDIKVFNDQVQVKQVKNEIQVQTKDKNFSIFLSGIIEAKKVITKIIDATTNTTMAQRGSTKVKGAIDLVDDTLGLDTRGMVKGVMENGIKGTIINGIKRKKDK